MKMGPWIFCVVRVVVYFLKTRREPSANGLGGGFQPGGLGNSTNTQNSQQRTTKITFPHSSARQKGGQHQHAHAAAKNTNPHKARILPASHGEKSRDWCGWSMAGNQHGKSAFGTFSWPLSALVRKVPILGTPRILPYCPPRKEGNNLGTTKKKRGKKHMLKPGKHSLV